MYIHLDYTVRLRQKQKKLPLRLNIADMELWYGRVPGYKIVESGNIADCLHSSKIVSAGM